MITWPDTLPQAPLLDGYQEKPADNVLRTAMDQGPAKLRARSSAGVGTLMADYILTRPQIATLLDFYHQTLAQGVRAFIFTHPRTQDSINCRFRRPPDLQAQNGLYMRVSLELEVMP